MRFIPKLYFQIRIILKRGGKKGIYRKEREAEGGEIKSALAHDGRVVVRLTSDLFDVNLVVYLCVWL